MEELTEYPVVLACFIVLLPMYSISSVVTGGCSRLKSFGDAMVDVLKREFDEECRSSPENQEMTFGTIEIVATPTYTVFIA
mmetsp:Transcript_12554/g.27622  ORF Transcript_12554/g.27622 Transcript_12554/m.27622 type:complete len:81 (-) Transcript_12554:43-285(-)